MKAKWKLCIFTLGAALYMGPSAQTWAGLIAINSSQTNLGINDVVQITFDITGLTGSANDSLGGFDLDITYDQSTLQLQSFSFLNPASSNNQLDLPEPPPFPFLGTVTATGGIVDAFALSGNSSSFLDAQQLNSFSFLSLNFLALAATSSTTVAIDLGDPNLVFSDPTGGDLPITFRNSSVNLQVNDGSNPVPSPGVLSLLMIGGIGMVFSKRRDKH